MTRLSLQGSFKTGFRVGGRVSSEADGPASTGPGLPVGQTRPPSIGVLKLPLSMAAVAMAFASTLWGAETDGISVVGIGKVKARPSIVEMSGTVVGDAELAGDAVTKYHGNRQAAIDAIGALNIEGLTIDGGGIAIKSEMNEAQVQAMRRGMPAPAGSNKLSISEPLKLRLTGVDQMDTEQLLETIVKIVDAGKDAGVLIGPQLNYNPYYGYQGQTSGALATFKLDKVDELKAKAYERAIADARKQAGRLATLAGVKLGGVTSIREGAVPKNNQQQVVYAYPGMATQQDEDQYASTDLNEITVQIVLQVEFAIEE